MKVVHGLTLLALSIYIIFKAAKNRGILLKQKMMDQLVFVSWALCLMYVIPFCYFIGATIYDAPSSKLHSQYNIDWFAKVMGRFSTWMLTMFERTEIGAVGFTISILIHLQLLGLLGFLTCLAYKSKKLLERKDKQK